MENNKRIVLSLTLVAIIAVSAVGVGFAYTAMTTNSDNTATPEYITLIQGDTGAYSFSPASDNNRVYWNANDYKDGNEIKTEYTLTGVVDRDSVQGYDLVKLGKSFTLNAESTGASTLPTIVIDISAENFIKPTDGTVIIMKTIDNMGTNDVTDDTPQYFILDSNNSFKELTPPSTTGTGQSITVTKTQTGYSVITVTMFYGYLTNSKVTKTHGPNDMPIGPSQNPINGAKLMFTINVEGGNGEGDTPLQGITLTKYSMSLSQGGTDTSTIQFDPPSAINKGVTCSTSNSSVATVNESNGTVTVTGGQTAGTAIITIVSNEGSYTTHIAVTVTEE